MAKVQRSQAQTFGSKQKSLQVSPLQQIVTTSLATVPIPVRNLENLPDDSLLDLAGPITYFYPKISRGELIEYLIHGHLLRNPKENLANKITRYRIYQELNPTIKVLLYHLYNASNAAPSEKKKTKQLALPEIGRSLREDKEETPIARFLRAEKIGQNGKESVLIHPFEAPILRYGENLEREQIAQSTARTMGILIPPDADPDVYFYDFLLKLILLAKDEAGKVMEKHVEDYSTSGEFQGRLSDWYYKKFPTD